MGLAERAGGNRRLFESGQTFPFVGVDRAVNDGATIDAFPGVEDEEEVRKPLHHHQAFAFWTIHKTLQISIPRPMPAPETVSRIKQKPSPKMYYLIISMP